MKNLKLFVAPLLGATLLLTACGPKAMDVKDFRAKVEEKFKLETIQEKYKGLKQHMTGTMGMSVDETHEIADAVPVSGSTGIYEFTFTDGFSSSGYYDILSVQLIDDVFEKEKEAGMTVNYFISGDTYTIEMKTEFQGAKMSAKQVYNKEFVITYTEQKVSGKGVSADMHLNFKYEK